MNARTMSITAAAELLDWRPLVGIESGIEKLLAG
jgi:nucleoside-diphosphate-sugar epimerase